MEHAYIDVQLNTSIDPAELLAMLDSGESLGSCEIEGVTHVYWPAAAWRPGWLAKLKRVLRTLGENPERVIRGIVPVPEIDWNGRWAESLQPIRVGRRLWIRQSWNHVTLQTGEIELIVDPGRAFGSGYHQTTRMLLEWLDERIGGGERMLDVGTGSGILAMAALRFGCASALGIDNDAEAIDCARSNALANGFGPELQLITASVDDLAPSLFDLIVANLDRRTLDCFAAELLARVTQGGRLLLSGLLPEDADDVLTAFSSFGARLLARKELEEWLALEMER
jgi:ribosomal protein L11 methyltransferase